MKAKSESRKLAELIARQRGIKVKSAQSWLSRVARGKVQKPKYGLTEYARRKVKKFVAAAPAKKAAAPARPAAAKRANFNRSDQFIVPVRATFDFYGNDKRHRTVNLNLSGRELNKFMNAKTPAAALDSLTKTGENKFLQNAKISDLEFFRVEGSERGPEFFD